MGAVVDGELEQANIVLSRKSSFDGVSLSSFLSTLLEQTGTFTCYHPGTYLEPVQEGLQIIQPEGAPNRDGLCCVSSPEEAIGIATDGPQDYRKT